MSGAESFLSGTGTCRIQVEDLDELSTEYQSQGVLAAGATVREQWWGDRDFVVLDPDRSAVTFFEHSA